MVATKCQSLEACNSNLAGSEMFDNQDFFNKVVENTFWCWGGNWNCPSSGGSDGSSSSSSSSGGGDPPQDPPPPPPSPPPPPLTRVVTLTAGKSSKFYTVTHVHDPAKVTVTRLLTWTDPNACYGATCKKTITGYRTVTNVVTLPGQTLGNTVHNTVTIPLKNIVAE